MEPIRFKTDVKDSKTALGYLEWEYSRISGLPQNLSNIDVIKSELEYVAYLIHKYIPQNEEGEKLTSKIYVEIKWINKNKRLNNFSKALRIYNQNNRLAVKLLNS